MKIDLGGPYRIAKTGLGDHILYNPADDYIGRSFELYDEFSAIELRFLLSGTAPGHTVIDVGANIGAFTVPLARKAKRVVAIEPQRMIFQMLCANLALNGLTNVLALHNAAGEEDGEVVVPAHDPNVPRNFGGVSVGGDQRGERVRVIRLDDLRLPEVHLIKIDVEGAERDVLRGARGMIAAHKPVLYIENDRPEKSAALLEAIFALDYRAYWHVPPLFNPANAAGSAENVFPGTVSVNVICWHEDRLAPNLGEIEAKRVTGPTDHWRRLSRR